MNPSLRRDPVAIECKWSATDFDPTHLKAFRRRYPRGESLVVTHDIERSFARTYGDVPVRFVNLRELIEKLKSSYIEHEV